VGDRPTACVLNQAVGPTGRIGHATATALRVGVDRMTAIRTSRPTMQSRGRLGCRSDRQQSLAGI